MEALPYWLWLTMVLGTGNPLIWKLMEQQDTPKAACAALQTETMQQALALPEVTRRKIRQIGMEQCQAVLKACWDRNIQVTCYGADDYPEALESIYNPPAVLYYQGDLSILDTYPAITVVGTRTPSAYSVQVADTICRELVRANLTIVSGFALGLDAVAHKAALLEHGRTVAVMGCGLDVPYPRANDSAKPLIAKRGLLLTEYPPGSAVRPQNFPKRNRILAAISQGTLVIQAALGSGSLITASLAAEQGKDVFCVPPADIFDNQYAGVVKYLRDGAIPVFSHLDILNEYYTTYAHKLSAAAVYVCAEAKTEESSLFRLEGAESEALEAGSSNHQQPAASAQTASVQQGKQEEKPAETQPLVRSHQRNFDGLEGLPLQIAVLLSQETQMHMDAMAVQLDADPDELAAALTELEIAGWVTRLPGQLFGIL